jgi:hypothetical protein
MAINENDAQILRALDEAQVQHQELTDLLDFYRDLYGVQFEAKAGLPAPEARPESAVRDAVAMGWRLEGGIPQLTFDQLALDPDSFLALVHRVVDVLLRHNPGWQIDWQEWPPEKLIGLAHEVFETWETLTAPRAAPLPASGAASGAAPPGHVHPAALAVGFGLAPYLQDAAEAILPHLDLSLWSQGYCPVCGGQPNMALLKEERGARQLMCARCASLWPYSRTGCPFCRSRDKQDYYRSDDGVYRLYVCPNCHRYLKTVDLREVHRPVYPMVERLITVGMDLAARQEGFED